MASKNGELGIDGRVGLRMDEGEREEREATMRSSSS